MGKTDRVINRIQKDLEDLRLHRHSDFQLDLVENSTNQLTGHIFGRAETPYEGRTYQLSFEIPPNYPFRPPKVRFISHVWHHKVNLVTGEIYLDILKDGIQEGKIWSAYMTLRTVMSSLYKLMTEQYPNKIHASDSPCVNQPKSKQRLKRSLPAQELLVGYFVKTNIIVLIRKILIRKRIKCFTIRKLYIL